MATFRGQSTETQFIGSAPPNLVWTIVRGDTASFRVYVEDDSENPLNIGDWDIQMDIKRKSHIVLTLLPEATINDGDGEFTVSLTSQQSNLLDTGDIFDIEMTDGNRVWTVASGTMTVLEDVTN